MPLGVTVTGANENDGVQAGEVLNSLVVRPREPESPPAAEDARSRPTVHADGAYHNRPTRERVAAAGFRLRPVRKGRKRTGAGRIRQAVERCHNFLAQFGRIRVRLDRSRKRYLNWVEMAACVRLIRSGFVR